MQFGFLQSWAPQLLSILRITTAATFLTHGTMKLLGWPAPFPYPLNGLTTTAAVLEIIGGLLLIIGLFSRPVAFILSGLMAFATSSPMPRSFFPVLNGGEAAMLFCFVFLFIAAAGPGAWSVDAALGKDK
ncbi:DoxX family protein [Mesorhizobium amorphae]|uniref:DoxX family protein n=1 Tax=Mesorhizobium amorphae TaxID=71433 RepID=UPI0011856A87|nr:DoxX family protein [Mesorhizobium amorphae]